MFIVDVIGVLIMNKNNKKVSVYHRCSISEGYPFLYLSSNFLNLVGWSREEIESEFDNKLWNMIHPEDRNFNVASNMCEFRLLCKDGYHSMCESFDLEGDILHGNMVDMTEFQLENKVLSALTNEYTSLVLCDLKQDTVKVLKQDEDIHSNIQCYTESLHYFYDHILIQESCPEYLEILSCEPLMDRLRKQKSLDIQYQITPNGNGTVNLLARVVFLFEDTDHFKIAMAFRPVDEIIKKENVLELQREIIEGLGKEYFSVLLLELDRGQIFSYREVGQNGKRIADFCRAYENQWELFIPAYAKKMVSDESRENFMAQLSYEFLCSNNEDFSMTYEFMSPDGIIYHQARVAYVKKKDRTRAVVIGTRNIDDLIKKERMQEAKLKEAYVLAEKANEAKTEFLNNMSHDIRTPMNVILGYNQLMKEKLTDPLLMDYQYKIEQSGKLLLSIINDVLDMARIESGKAEVVERPEKIGNVVSELESVFSSSAKEKSIDLNSSVDIVHNYVLCDGIKLREILMNLVWNAIKYTPNNGSVSIRVKELDCDRLGYAKIQTDIIDTGVGMSAEYLPTLFDSFSREYNTTIGKVAGTGLGMSIVKKLVDMMGGQILVKSSLGKGSCFSVILEHPIVEDFKESKSSKIDENIMLDGKRVLLAEDNDLNAEIARAILEMNGMQMDRVVDGEQCVSLLERMPEDMYDLILMDVQMPNMNGYEATKKIRNMDNLKKANIPVVAMTANAFESDKQMAFDSGMDGHISKPIDMDKMKSEIVQILTKK